MGRADELRAQMEAEIAVVELEEALIHQKGLKKPDPEQLRETKLALRAARQRFRELREAAGLTDAAGAVTAGPAPVRARAGVQDLGGDGS